MDRVKVENSFEYSSNEGKLETIRGNVVPDGMLTVIDTHEFDAEGRIITSRAITMTAGLFKFAESVNSYGFEDEDK